MIKRIELKKGEVWWGGINNATYQRKNLVICVDKLIKYFALEDKPDKITLILSDKKLENGYFVKIDEASDMDVTKSNGLIASYLITPSAQKLLRKYPKGIWAAIETYE